MNLSKRLPFKKKNWEGKKKPQMIKNCMKSSSGGGRGKNERCAPYADAHAFATRASALFSV